MSTVPKVRICKKNILGVDGGPVCSVFTVGNLRLTRGYNGRATVCSFGILVTRSGESQYGKAQYDVDTYASSEPDVDFLDDVTVYTEHGHLLFTGVVTRFNPVRTGAESVVIEVEATDCSYFLERSIIWSADPFTIPVLPGRELIIQNSGIISAAIFRVHFSRDRMQALNDLTLEVSNYSMAELIRRVANQDGVDFWIDGYGFFNYRILTQAQHALFLYSDRGDLNLCSASEDLGDGYTDLFHPGAWEFFDVTIIRGATDGPNGEPGIADNVNLAGANGNIGKLATVERDTPHTLSVWARMTGGTLDINLHGDSVERVQNLVVDCFALRNGIDSEYWKLVSGATLSTPTVDEQAPFIPYVPLPFGHHNSTKLNFGSGAGSEVYQSLGQWLDPVGYPHRAGLAVVGLYYRAGIWARTTTGTKNFRLYLVNQDIVSNVRTDNGNFVFAEFTATTTWQFFELPALQSDSTYMRVVIRNQAAGGAGTILFSGVVVCPCGASSAGDFHYKQWFTSKPYRVPGSHIVNPYMRISRVTDAVTLTTAWQQLSVNIPKGVPYIGIQMESSDGPGNFNATQVMLERGDTVTGNYQTREGRPTAFHMTEGPSFDSDVYEFSNGIYAYGESSPGAVAVDQESVDKYSQVAHIVIDRSLNSTALKSGRAAAELQLRKGRNRRVGVTAHVEGLEFGDLTTVWSHVRGYFGVEMVVRGTSLTVEGALVRHSMQLANESPGLAEAFDSLRRLVQQDRI